MEGHCSTGQNGKWKSRTNRELEEMSKAENIVKWIKWQRISWLGHLERMEEDRMSKKIFSQEFTNMSDRNFGRKIFVQLYIVNSQTGKGNCT